MSPGDGPPVPSPPPTLYGRLVDGGTTLEVWCRHCREHHYHGWPGGPADTAPEHRAAHCDGGPYVWAGYMIAPRAAGVAG